MKQLKFELRISAPKEKVWEALWADANYRKWTSIFGENSHAVGDWKEGSEILFLGNEQSGMYSMIEKLNKYQEMTFKHLGELKNGERIPGDWSGALEKYVLKEKDNVTVLVVTMDSNQEFASYFEEKFPKALNIVKEIAEC
ncbi:MAG: SRPBCC domain-containing protein [Pelobium sp.]